MKTCFCGSAQSYENCCGIYITTDQPAPTPETLMRSRYSAYHQANIDYIKKTMKGAAAKGFDAIEATLWAKQVIWQGLKVIKSSQTEDQGSVEFIVQYVFNGRRHIMHEISEFHLENGRWYYVDGVAPDVTEL